MDHTFMERFESVPSDWIKLEETEYLDNGVAFIEEAENLGTFVVGKIMNTNRTGAFYYFGEDSSFIEDYNDELHQIQINFELQEEVGFFPAWIEKISPKCIVSVIKLIRNPIMYMVDVMFDYNGFIYSYHTYIDKNEKKLSIKDLMLKYEDIKFVVGKLEN